MTAEVEFMPLFPPRSILAWGEDARFARSAEVREQTHREKEDRGYLVGDARSNKRQKLLD
jgi:hypothetical protein